MSSKIIYLQFIILIDNYLLTLKLKLNYKTKIYMLESAKLTKYFVTIKNNISYCNSFDELDNFFEANSKKK